LPGRFNSSCKDCGLLAEITIVTVVVNQMDRKFNLIELTGKGGIFLINF